MIKFFLKEGFDKEKIGFFLEERDKSVVMFALYYNLQSGFRRTRKYDKSKVNQNYLLKCDSYIYNDSEINDHCHMIIRK